MYHPLMIEALMIQELQRHHILSEQERHALERRERDGLPVPEPGLFARVRRRIVARAASRRRAPAPAGVMPVEA